MCCERWIAVIRTGAGWFDLIWQGEIKLYSYEMMIWRWWLCFYFFASSLDTVSLATGFGLTSNKNSRPEGKRFTISVHQCENSEKGAGSVSEAPRHWKQLRKSPKNPPCGSRTVCLFRSFVISRVHTHSFTLQEKKTGYGLIEVTLVSTDNVQNKPFHGPNAKTSH